MQSDKDLKAEFRKKASESPEKFYATRVLMREGFSRKRCRCGKYFWSIASNTCGDPLCSGGFRFIGSSPARRKLGYVEVWKKFSSFFEKRGYTPIARYPVVARWRDDMDFVMASICDFQPYVVKGQIKPPANPLVVPQFCLRFNDIDNVGVTGAHYTGFVMIGQHAFMPPEKWDQEQYFEDIHSWLKSGLGLPNKEIIFHEDAWAGGGNFGPCMEFFSRGLELGNQVYMQYEVTPAGSKELSLKVLDMGMGQERNAWFTNGNTTSYESTFPTVMKRLYLTTGVKPDQALMKRFLPYSAQLNVDETKDLEKAWKAIAESLGEDSGSLRERILPLSALFSVAEHSRSLLFALSDGALPSNSSGGYNLRLILRRALAFIDRYNWDIDLAELCRLHAGYLSGQFPELSDNLDDVARVLEVEKQKYRETRARSKQITSRLISRNVTTDSLVRLYDSNGITPGLVAEEAARIGKKITIPDDFYARLGELHEKGADKRGEIRADETDPVVAGLGSGVPKTIISYYEDKKTDHSRVLGVYDCGKAYVLLESTIFYPTGGGQNSDQGYINREFVDAAIKNAGYVFHRINKKAADIPFKVGDTVELKLDDARRLQLSQHHTAAHIINGSARAVLGNHIWQAGAAKDVDKARLDITHYQQLSDDDVKRIEGLANEIVEKNIVINKFVERRDIAEKRFGFRLYQGGAVPGLEIRVVEIPSFDVEACGGTHLDFTGQVGRIRILRTVKIQDGVVRLEFVAGRAAEEAASEMQSMLREAGRLLGCKPEQVPARADELFSKWKQAVKKHCKVDKKLTSTEFFKGDALGETCRILRTQPEHVNKTIRRFLKELEQA